MKPLHLVMSAFGSYAGEERVDFSKAGNGVFLITGDTGAGKTTVFDAMVYALYDRTSGGERSGNMMRSQFAKPETETFVVFTFSVRNQIYTVRRNPEYQIQKQLKEVHSSIDTMINSIKGTDMVAKNYNDQIKQIKELMDNMLGMAAEMEESFKR